MKITFIFGVGQNILATGARVVQNHRTTALCREVNTESYRNRIRWLEHMGAGERGRSCNDKKQNFFLERLKTKLQLLKLFVK